MSGGNGGGDTHTTTTQELSPEQKKILGLATPILSDYLKGGRAGLEQTVFPGSTVVGPNPLETQAQQQLVQQAQGPLASAANATLAGNTFLTSGAALDPRTNPALQGTINAAVRPLTESFGEVVLPQIRSDAVLTGGYGSNRQEINERLAARDLERQVGDVGSAVAFQGYNAGLDAMGRAQAFAPSALQGAQLPAMTTAGVGAQQREFEQAALTDAINRWYNQRFLPLSIAQGVAGTAFGYPGGSTTSAVSGGGAPGISPFAGAVGGASIGAPFGPWGAGIGAGLGALLSVF